MRLGEECPNGIGTECSFKFVGETVGPEDTYWCSVCGTIIYANDGCIKEVQVPNVLEKSNATRF
jgi:hypothetical protein